jgi:FAD/FMN-containing dehydrogenase
MPYPVVNTMFDEAYPAGLLNYWKSSFMTELSDDAIDTMISLFASCPSNMTSLAVEHHHGAATRVAVADTAVPHRDAGYNFLLTSVWTDQATSEENVAWTRSTYAAMEPYVVARRYVNYLSGDDAAAPGTAIYGPNYDRLAELKARYDPDNVFHLNQNIEPEGR